MQRPLGSVKLMDSSLVDSGRVLMSLLHRGGTKVQGGDSIYSSHRARGNRAGICWTGLHSEDEILEGDRGL